MPSLIEGRPWIWIESGHLWLIWTGGLPFFVAFFALLVVGMRATLRLQRRRYDAFGAASAAAFGSLWVLCIGQIFDPFLTLRGVADILWPLLALGVAADRLAAPVRLAPQWLSGYIPSPARPAAPPVPVVVTASGPDLPAHLQTGVTR